MGYFKTSESVTNLSATGVYLSPCLNNDDNKFFKK